MSKENFYAPEFSPRTFSYDDGISVSLVESWGSSYRIVQSARVSYGNQDRSKGYEKDLELLVKLMENGHLGPFEHVGATFKIEAPLFVARQIFRHRTFSYNEISRRYTKSGIKFWLPDEERLNPKFTKVLEDFYQYSYNTYLKLLEEGVPKELARVVLPMGTFSVWYMSGNLRNWLHFLDLRLDSHAQEETRKVAKLIEKFLFDVFQDVMESWKNSKTRGVW